MAYPETLPDDVVANTDKVKASWAQAIKTAISSIYTKIAEIDQVVSLGAYQLVTSISSNDLVVALKNLDGDDFSTGSPLEIRLADTKQTISAALSVTKADATNWANLGGAELATQHVDLFAYLILETGASAGVKLGWSRIPYGTTVDDFSSTTTDKKYLAGPTNYNSTDKVQNIGRFNAILSAGAGYTWSLPATSVIINEPCFTTRWLTWSPVHSRSGTNYTNLPTTATAIYRIDKHSLLMEERHAQNATPGGTDYQQFSIPYSARNNFIPAGTTANESTGITFLGFIVGVDNLRIFKYDGTAEATASQYYHINANIPI